MSPADPVLPEELPGLEPVWHMPADPTRSGAWRRIKPRQPAQAEPEAGPPPDEAEQVRLIEGFVELMAYTRFLLETPPAEAPGFEEARARVQELLDRAEAFRIRHDFSEPEWREALFAVTAWMDERILCSGWEGRHEWIDAQLQRRLFGTSRGGEIFFEKLAALAFDAWQVREVFDYCLALGFQGRFYGTQDRGRLREIRRAQPGRLPSNLRPRPGEPLFPTTAPDLAASVRQRRIPYRYVTYTLLALVPPVAYLLLFAGFRAYLDSLLEPLLR